MRDKIIGAGAMGLLLAFGLAPAGLAQPQDEYLYDDDYVEDVNGMAPPLQPADGVEYYDDDDDYYEEPAPPPPLQPSVQPRPTAPVRPTPSAPVRQPRAPVPPGPRPGAAPQLTTADANAQVNDEALEPGAPIRFDCDNCELIRVIETLARLTGRNFDVDPNIGSTPVTIISHSPMPPELAFQLLESILASRGFSMVETLEGHLIKILPQQNAVPSPMVPLRLGPDGIPYSGDALSTHVIAVQYADPAEMATALKLLGSPVARVDTYAPTRTLLITDTGDGLRRMFRFLDVADVPGGETNMEIFMLEYTRAEILQQQLEQVLLDTGGAPQMQQQQRPQVQQAPTPTRPTRTVRPTVPGMDQSQIIGSSEEVLRMVTDERLNALIVMATGGMMERARDLIIKLDTPTPYEANNLHIYELLNADVESVETALQAIVGAAPRAQQAGQGGQAGPTAEVAPFERNIQITRYDQTNSLLVVASPQDYKHLEAFIARLDVPQRQVHVETMIMRVRTTNDFVLDVDAAAVTGRTGFGITNSSNIASLLPTLEAANAIAGDPRAALSAGLLTLGASNTLTTGVYRDITVNINGFDVKVPFVPVLLTALEALTEVEVLSQPSLVTVDNEEASIVVGQEVPFIVGTGSPRTSAEGDLISTGFTRVQRQEVGVKLKVTPQISEGDYVALQLEVEKSNVAANPVGDVNILGPTTDKSIVTNKVVVKDGSTALIGGLIEDAVDRARAQTPLLGDLPLVGWMFGRRSNIQSKSNIVVLVTPHIIKEGVDLDRVTEFKVREYQDAHADFMFDKGFFTQIKRKRDARQNWRPTGDAAAEAAGRAAPGGQGQRFGRGDIRR